MPAPIRQLSVSNSQVIGVSKDRLYLWKLQKRAQLLTVVKETPKSFQLDPGKVLSCSFLKTNSKQCLVSLQVAPFFSIKKSQRITFHERDKDEGKPERRTQSVDKDSQLEELKDYLSSSLRNNRNSDSVQKVKARSASIKEQLSRIACQSKRLSMGESKQSEGDSLEYLAKLPSQKTQGSMTFGKNERLQVSQLENTENLEEEDELVRDSGDNPSVMKSLEFSQSTFDYEVNLESPSHTYYLRNGVDKRDKLIKVSNKEKGDQKSRCMEPNNGSPLVQMHNQDKITPSPSQIKGVNGEVPPRIFFLKEDSESGLDSECWVLSFLFDQAQCPSLKEGGSKNRGSISKSQEGNRLSVFRVTQQSKHLTNNQFLLSKGILLLNKTKAKWLQEKVVLHNIREAFGRLNLFVQQKRQQDQQQKETLRAVRAAKLSEILNSLSLRERQHKEKVFAVWLLFLKEQVTADKMVWLSELIKDRTNQRVGACFLRLRQHCAKKINVEQQLVNMEGLIKSKLLPFGFFKIKSFFFASILSSQFNQATYLIAKVAQKRDYTLAFAKISAQCKVQRREFICEQFRQFQNLKKVQFVFLKWLQAARLIASRSQTLRKLLERQEGKQIHALKDQGFKSLLEFSVEKRQQQHQKREQQKQMEIAYKNKYFGSILAVLSQYVKKKVFLIEKEAFCQLKSTEKAQSYMDTPISFQEVQGKRMAEATNSKEKQQDVFSTFKLEIKEDDCVLFDEYSALKSESLPSIGSQEIEDQIKRRPFSPYKKNKMIELSPENSPKNCHLLQESLEARNLLIDRRDSKLGRAEPHEMKEDSESVPSTPMPKTKPNSRQPFSTLKLNSFTPRPADGAIARTSKKENSQS